MNRKIMFKTAREDLNVTNSRLIRFCIGLYLNSSSFWEQLTNSYLLGSASTNFHRPIYNYIDILLIELTIIEIKLDSLILSNAWFCVNSPPPSTRHKTSKFQNFIHGYRLNMAFLQDSLNLCVHDSALFL